jgi:hypothetical protein
MMRGGNGFKNLAFKRMGLLAGAGFEPAIPRRRDYEARVFSGGQIEMGLRTIREQIENRIPQNTVENRGVSRT